MCALQFRNIATVSPFLRRRTLPIALAVCLAASTPVRSATPGDPWERANRKVFIVSAVFDKVLFHPLARLYRALTPGPIGKGLHNVLINLSEPVVIANGVLQARPRAVIAAATRLGINTTLGLGGLIDVTARRDPHVDNSFGNTLGRWGVGPGPYLFVPLLGPSSVRDLFGAGFDAALDPLHMVAYPYRTQVTISRTLVGALDQRNASQDQMAALLDQAADPYATLRSVYLQDRAGEIAALRGVPTTQQPLPSLPDLDEPPAKDAPAKDTPP